MRGACSCDFKGIVVPCRREADDMEVFTWMWSRLLPVTCHFFLPGEAARLDACLSDVFKRFDDADYVRRTFVTRSKICPVWQAQYILTGLILWMSFSRGMQRGLGRACGVAGAVLVITWESLRVS